MASRNRAADVVNGARRLKLLEILDGFEYAVQFLSNAVWIPTHYHSRGSRYCHGPGECIRELHRSRVIWKGYAPCLVWDPSINRWRSLVVELTEELGRRFGKRSLRGEVWIIHRDGLKKEQKPLVARLSEELPAEAVPEPFPVTGVLFDLYRVDEPKTWDFPPLPERLYFADREGPAPNGLLPGGRLPR